MKPLADRIRPESLSDYIGQDHLVGEGAPLQQAIKKRTAPNMILWGPPGVGKTTLALMIAKSLGRRVEVLSAVRTGKRELQKIIATIPRVDMFNQNTTGVVLLLDEIHRFNKAQQDFLLPYVEDGTITLIGATTENPSYEVIPALLSRAQVFILKPLTAEDIARVIERACGILEVRIDEDVSDFLLRYADGDARAALTLLESAAKLYDDISIGNLKATLHSTQRYDRDGDEHYDTVSAFVKALRHSDLDAAMYYCARMLNGGEPAKFIARRLLIFASEDIGIADHSAVTIANSTFDAVERLGMPECQFSIAQCVYALATAPKSRVSADSLNNAKEEVYKGGNKPIPLWIRNNPTALMRREGYSTERLLPEGVTYKAERY